MNTDNQKKNHQEKDEDKKDKLGVIPNEELDGSDADKAYDENGDFNQLGDISTDQSGSDADADEKST